MKLKHLTIATAIASLLLVSIARAELRPVALRGEVAPGVSSGDPFRSFGTPSINNSGNVAVWGLLYGESSLSGGGIWSEEAGDLRLLIRHSQQAPDTDPGVTFSSFRWMTSDPTIVPINEAGEVSLFGNLSLSAPSVTSANNIGIWSGDRVTLGQVARLGDVAPGLTPSDQFNLTPNFNDILINHHNHVALRGTFLGPSAAGILNKGIWLQRDGTLDVVAASNTQAPGLPTGTVFSQFLKPRLNDQSETVFWSSLDGTGVYSGNDSGIFASRGGVLEVVARESQSATGLGSGVIYDGLSSAHNSINESGQIAFLASLSGTGVNSTNDSAIYLDTGSVSELVLRTGQQAPELAPGVTISEFSTTNSSLLVNDGGQIAVLATLSGPGITSANDKSLWIGTPGDMHLLVQEGDSIPGEPGRTIGEPGFGGFSLNALGQVAFRSRINGLGIDGSNDFGLFATDQLGELALIVQESDLLESSPSVYSDVRSFDIYLGTGNGDGLASSFNDLGELAFKVDFWDGREAVYVSNTVMIPEPASYVLALLAAAALPFIRQRLRST